MKWKLFTLLFAAMLALSACGNNGTNDDQGANDNNDKGAENTRYNTDNNNDGGQTLRNQENADRDRDHDRGDINRDHHRDHYDLSKEAADRITDEIDDINHAYVVTTKNNAYVAASMSDHTNNKGADNRDNKNHDTNMNNATDKSVKDNQSDNGHQLTDDIKRKIKDIVKSTDKDIDHVYVSTNPDFMNLANNYANDMNNGKPVRGFFDQMGNMIERVFPQARENR